MLSTLTSLFGWALALFLALVTGLLAFNKQSGLTMIQHRAEMLPQVLLVHYLGLSALSLVAVIFNAPRLFFAMMLTVMVISLGNLFIYRRSGHVWWLHAVVAGCAGIGAVAAFFTTP